eukprot:GILJ01027488.1.p1 GENE.GILJ01027488.1~~GILJ01027488.1.p1  ORF type:complete len:676 (-),score=89.62 GILJ01027488.1:357-2291(-)
MLAAAREGTSGGNNKPNPLTPAEYRSLRAGSGNVRHSTILKASLRRSPTQSYVNRHGKDLMPDTPSSRGAGGRSNSVSFKHSYVSPLLLDDYPMPTPIFGRTSEATPLTQAWRSPSKGLGTATTPYRNQQRESSYSRMDTRYTSSVTGAAKAASYKDMAFTNHSRGGGTLHTSSTPASYSAFALPLVFADDNVGDQQMTLTVATLAQLGPPSDTDSDVGPSQLRGRYGSTDEFGSGAFDGNSPLLVPQIVAPTIYQQFNTASSKGARTNSHSPTDSSLAATNNVMLLPEASFGAISTMVSADFGANVSPHLGPKRLLHQLGTTVANSPRPFSVLNSSEIPSLLTSVKHDSELPAAQQDGPSNDDAARVQKSAAPVVDEVDHEAIAEAAKILMSELGTRATAAQRTLLSTIVGRHTSAARKINRRWESLNTSANTNSADGWSLKSEGTSVLSSHQVLGKPLTLNREATIAAATDLLRSVTMQVSRSAGNTALRAQRDRVKAGDSSVHGDHQNRSHTDPHSPCTYRFSIPEGQRTPRRTKGEALLGYYGDDRGSPQRRQMLADLVRSKVIEEKRYLEAEGSERAGKAVTHKKNKPPVGAEGMPNTSDIRHSYISTKHPFSLPMRSTTMRDPFTTYRATGTFEVQVQ